MRRRYVLNEMITKKKGNIHEHANMLSLNWLVFRRYGSVHHVCTPIWIVQKKIKHQTTQQTHVHSFFGVTSLLLYFFHRHHLFFIHLWALKPVVGSCIREHVAPLVERAAGHHRSALLAVLKPTLGLVVPKAKRPVPAALEW